MKVNTLLTVLVILLGCYSIESAIEDAAFALRLNSTFLFFNQVPNLIPTLAATQILTGQVISLPSVTNSSVHISDVQVNSMASPNPLIKPIPPNGLNITMTPLTGNITWVIDNKINASAGISANFVWLLNVTSINGKPNVVSEFGITNITLSSFYPNVTKEVEDTVQGLVTKYLNASALNETFQAPIPAAIDALWKDNGKVMLFGFGANNHTNVSMDINLVADPEINDQNVTIYVKGDVIVSTPKGVFLCPHAPLPEFPKNSTLEILIATSAVDCIIDNVLKSEIISEIASFILNDKITVAVGVNKTFKFMGTTPHNALYFNLTTTGPIDIQVRLPNGSFVTYIEFDSVMELAANPYLAINEDSSSEIVLSFDSVDFDLAISVPDNKEFPNLPKKFQQEVHKPLSAESMALLKQKFTSTLSKFTYSYSVASNPALTTVLNLFQNYELVRIIPNNDLLVRAAGFN